KRYWLYPVRIQFGWKMDGTAQGGRAKRRARCGAAGARRRRSRTMGHHPGRGTHDGGGVEAELSNPNEIEHAISNFAKAANGGLIVAVSAASLIHRQLIIALAAKHRSPTAYAYRIFVPSGGY